MAAEKEHEKIFPQAYYAKLLDTERELLNMVNERNRQYSDHAFLSTSFSKDTALAFAETGDQYARRIVMEINTPKGTKVMSGNIKEKELVLMPATKIIISNIEVTETHIYVKGRIR